MYANIESLQSAWRGGEQLKWLFFWGHTPAGEAVDKSCLSQWYPSSFTLDGVTYLTAEHFMMAQKALLFGDQEAYTRVLAASHPNDAKRAGREVRNFDSALWDAQRFQIVVNGNLAKFAQQPALRDFLLATGDRVLVEASPVDPIWGIGLAADHADAQNPERWQGSNLLGFALMQVREMLRSA